MSDDDIDMSAEDLIRAAAELSDAARTGDHEKAAEIADKIKQAQRK